MQTAQEPLRAKVIHSQPSCYTFSACKSHIDVVKEKKIMTPPDCCRRKFLSTGEEGCPVEVQFQVHSRTIAGPVRVAPRRLLGGGAGGDSGERKARHRPRYLVRDKGSSGCTGPGVCLPLTAAAELAAEALGEGRRLRY